MGYKCRCLVTVFVSWCTNAKSSVYGICICGGDFEVEVELDKKLDGESVKTAGFRRPRALWLWPPSKVWTLLTGPEAF